MSSLLQKLFLAVTQAWQPQRAHDWGQEVTRELEGLFFGTAFRARGVVTADVPDLTQFNTQDPTNNDGIAVYLEGQTAFLARQTNSFQVGPWVVGAVDPVSKLAPLTRPHWFASGATLPIGQECRIGGEGNVYQNSVWATMASFNERTVDAQVFQWYPRVITGWAGLINGRTASITSMPLLNGASQIIVGQFPGAPVVAPDLTIRYIVDPGTLVVGDLGSATFQIIAAKGDNTVNAADGSGVFFVVINQA